ncbi:uncharacterized protein K452DRAFT_290238 [Aplosporella prunicola CBS 121167]|uniref:Uncharacterized protein n=1 Tax=Aplosporella prunicola CBS 121167 TaxID=1176127 RepID=A0A6A6B9I3_9PEZI|nr:uncharacterized protein K452DRAFT_290238 [Aplosporella prunicola CBS 121167]KAF2139141.1 hypothetical protein K452DRAFT_290238 [Aplosporella prunicola CBS 121167]
MKEESHFQRIPPGCPALLALSLPNSHTIELYTARTNFPWAFLCLSLLLFPYFLQNGDMNAHTTHNTLFEQFHDTPSQPHTLYARCKQASDSLVTFFHIFLLLFRFSLTNKETTGQSPTLSSLSYTYTACKALSPAQPVARYHGSFVILYLLFPTFYRHGYTTKNHRSNHGKTKQNSGKGKTKEASSKSSRGRKVAAAAR